LQVQPGGAGGLIGERAALLPARYALTAPIPHSTAALTEALTK
jgi:hypothetical protein